MKYLYAYDELSAQAQEMAEHHVVDEYSLTGPEDDKNDVIDFCRCFLWDRSGFPLSKVTDERMAFLTAEIEDSLGRLERTKDLDHIKDVRVWLGKVKKTAKVAALAINSKTSTR